MTTTLGGVTFDNDMVWIDEYLYKKVDATHTPTIGGGVNVQEYQKTEIGRYITLETVDGQGYQTKSTVDSIKALADDAAETYTLSIVHNSLSISKTVVFRNDIDGGPVQMEMQAPMDGLQQSGYWYGGVISLMVIST
jgi:hypothetical protein